MDASSSHDLSNDIMVDGDMLLSSSLTLWGLRACSAIFKTPTVTGIPVSLSEVLEVRGHSLAEDDVWACLLKGATPLKMLVDRLRDKHEDGPVLTCVTPDMFLLYQDGTTRISTDEYGGTISEEFLAPEVASSPNDADIEKTITSSPELLSLLNLMTVVHANARPSLAKVAQLAESKAPKHLDATSHIAELYKNIMGSEADLADVENDKEDLFAEIANSKQSTSMEDEPSEQFFEMDHKHGRLTPDNVHPTTTNGISVTHSPIVEDWQTFRTDDDFFTKPSVFEKHDASHLAVQSENSTTLDPWAAASATFDPGAQSTPLRNDKSRLAVGDPSSTGAPSTRLNWETFMEDGTEDVSTSSTNYHATPSSIQNNSDTDNLDDSAFSQGAEQAYSMLSDASFEPRKVSKSFDDANLAKTFHADFGSAFASNAGAACLSPHSKAFNRLSVRDIEVGATLKEHSKLVEGSRAFHSEDCGFCSPEKVKRLQTGGLTGSAPGVHTSRRTHSATVDELLLPSPTPAEPLVDDLQESFGREDKLQLSGALEDFSLHTPVKSRSRLLQAEEQRVQRVDSSELETDSLPVAITFVDVEPVPVHVREQRTPPLTTPPQPAPRQKSFKSELIAEPTPVASAQPPPADVVSNSRREENNRVVDEVTNDDDVKYRKVQQPAEDWPSHAVAVPSVAEPRKAVVVDTSKSRAGAGGIRDPSMVGPEFLIKCRQSSIRLRAPDAHKSYNIFRPSHDTNVLVILLNGQRVDVGCHTLSTAGEVFDVVVRHTNLTENVFFGLTYQKDGEHFFLEPQQKLVKFAPPGWRDQKQHAHARVIFTLFLRVKFYPTALELIRSEATFHQLYLQLRRDIIEEQLQCDRDAAFQLAALAMQAEFGDRPSDRMNYFQLDHYLPRRQIDDVVGTERDKSLLSELHSQYAGMSASDAEREFVRTCQGMREYGIHFHRLFRSKPSHSLAPTPLGDPDTGTSIWVGIMPRGVIMFEERSGERIPLSQHPWHSTQTLQYDRKKFAIVPKTDSNNNSGKPLKKFVYYTDSHKKSGYYVQFASAQHRFLMKMRQWAINLASEGGDTGTLERVNRGHKALTVNGRRNETLSSYSAKSSNADSGISREASPDAPRGAVSFDTVGNVGFSKSKDANRQNGNATKNSHARGEVSFLDAIEVSVPSEDQTLGVPDESVSDSLAQRLGAISPAAGGLASLSPSDYYVFDVTLIKDPQFGLGLTLVDGEIQGYAGVYVKSVTPAGPAQVNGRLRIGDRVLAVNGQDLQGLNRHDAVDLVRKSQTEVRLKILRLRSIYSSSEESLPYTADERSATLPVAFTSDDIEGALADRGAIIADTDSRLRPKGGSKSATLPSSERYRVNSVSSRSETSASGDEYETREVAAAIASKDATLSFSGLERPPVAESTPIATTDGNYNLKTTPVLIRARQSAMYSGIDSSSDEESQADKNSTKTGGSTAQEPTIEPELLQPKAERSSSRAAADREKRVSVKSADPLDWTEDIEYNETMPETFDGSEAERFEVTLAKNENGSLGIKVAGGKGQNKIYVKSLVAEPALSCASIRPGDRLVAVNGTSVELMSHAEVVELLKKASSPVSLGLSRGKHAMANKTVSDATLVLDEDTVKSEVVTLEVTLEKPVTGSLGLSLAKPTGPSTDGIYIRVITQNSVAAEDGRLKVGDRLWEINGESVANATPNDVVGMLKRAEGNVHLVIKREMTQGLF